MKPKRKFKATKGLAELGAGIGGSSGLMTSMAQSRNRSTAGYARDSIVGGLAGGAGGALAGGGIGLIADEIDYRKRLKKHRMKKKANIQKYPATYIVSALGGMAGAGAMAGHERGFKNRAKAGLAGALGGAALGGGIGASADYSMRKEEKKKLKKKASKRDLSYTRRGAVLGAGTGIIDAITSAKSPQDAMRRTAGGAIGGAALGRAVDEYQYRKKGKKRKADATT